MAVRLSVQTASTGLGLLISSKENFINGHPEAALEDFRNASMHLQPELIQKVYWHIWDLSHRPEGAANFGEEAMHNRLITNQPHDYIKAEAIEKVVRDYHRQTVDHLVRRLQDESVCAISQEIMRDPVIDHDGHTFDRHAIEGYRHYLQQHGQPIMCPISRERGSYQLIPNYAARNVVEINRQFGGRLAELAEFVEQTALINDRLRSENQQLKLSTPEQIQLQNQQIEVLVSQNRTLLQQMANMNQQHTQEKVAMTQQIARMEQQLAGVDQQNAQVREVVDQHIANYAQETATIARQLAQERQEKLVISQQLERANSTLQRQQENLVNMQYWDMIRLLMPCCKQTVINELANRSTTSN